MSELWQLGRPTEALIQCSTRVAQSLSRSLDTRVFLVEARPMPQLLLADTDRVEKSKKVKQWRPRGGENVFAYR